MDDGTDVPTDVLVDIFQRIQPNARRRLRLVCRHWRQAIDTRTATSLRSRAMTLIATVEGVYVFDDPSIELRSWKMPLLWMPQCPGRYMGRPNKVVGTRNGIICYCYHSGDILLHNPLTREMLAVPRLPVWHRTGTPIWHQTYGFTHSQATGRYMVVHVSVYYDQFVVFTLGEASWRGIDIPGDTYGPRCNLEDGFVTIDTTMYWVVKGKGAMVMSLDLDGEQVPSAIPLPSSISDGTWRLTEVLGRLSITDMSDVWVMERCASTEAKHARWSHWYSVRVWRRRDQPKWHDNQHLTWPHFAHGSNHVMTWEWLSTGGGCALYRHDVASNDDTTKARRGTVEIRPSNQGAIVAHISTNYDTFQRFDYVETTEPLSVYKCW